MHYEVNLNHKHTKEQSVFIDYQSTKEPLPTDEEKKHQRNKRTQAEQEKGAAKSSYQMIERHPFSFFRMQ